MSSAAGHDPGSKVSLRTILLIAGISVLVGIVVGVGIYRDQIAPFRATIVRVDDTSIPMRYFLKRLALSDEDPMTMLQTLVKEQIIKKVAPIPPYSIIVHDKDIDQSLSEIARGQSARISETDYKEWYRQQLNDSRLSDSEFRDIARTNMLTKQLAEYLEERIPTVAEQVHLHMILVSQFDEAKKAKERLDAGEDFAALAREIAYSDQNKGDGDLGWLPRAALSPSVAQVAFDVLGVGKVSEVLSLDEEHFAVIMVSEKVAAREIDDNSLLRIKARALDEWVDEQYQFHRVEFHGFHNGYDSKTDAWVRQKLQKMKK